MKRSAFAVTTIFAFIFAFIFLLGGGVLYLLYRSHDIIFLHLFDMVFTNLHFNLVRPESVLLSYIVYSLPNGLWLESGILFFAILWKQNVKNFLCYTFTLLLFALLYEAGQLLHIVKGTFDIYDIITIVVFAFLGIVFYFGIFLKEACK